MLILIIKAKVKSFFAFASWSLTEDHISSKNVFFILLWAGAVLLDEKLVHQH